MLSKGLKYFLLCLFVLSGFSGTVLAENISINLKGYDSSQTYSGPYPEKSLFMRRSMQKAYGSHQLLPFDQITCRAARQSLSLKGRWEGNLKANGACGDPAEPADWVTGNYLNYITRQ